MFAHSIRVRDASVIQNGSESRQVHEAYYLLNGSGACQPAESDEKNGWKQLPKRLTAEQEAFFDSYVEDHRLELLAELEQWEILHKEKQLDQERDEKKAA